MQTARASIKRKAEDSLNERPSKLVCSVVSSFSTITSRDLDNLTRQLYTFHGTRNGHFIPCVFALLPNKKEATYTRALQMLRHICREKNVSLHSEFFHFDLEDAMLSSCGHVFPDAKIKACNFHVGQAWHRKLQQIGLAAEFQSNSETSTCIKSFFGLPALDPHEVEDCFAFVVMNNCPDSKK
ncbi:hypothetical protein RRG08_039677 [Elysia crispata]|uniref:MULE transposase domain-containing protein n=1 Tax=Elysia crispata TaxID=231223 RepID=A0AAE0YAA2_9GAST|nr:hypothetical protein RRG08_039677 [Elysia crispata]